MKTFKLLLSTVLLVLLSTVPALAEKIPLPQRVLTAKKLFLVNDGCFNKLFEKFYGEVKKDGLFEIVESADEADLIATLSVKKSGIGVNVGMIQMENRETFLVLSDPKTRDQVWSDSVGHDFYGAGEKMMKNLKKRMSEIRKTAK